MAHRFRIAAFAALVVVLAGCVSLDYDLSTVPIPVSAKPAIPEDGEVEPFTIEAKNYLWVHGLFGESTPDVAALVAERSKGYDRIVGFRVQQTSNIHQWLLTHLSLTLVRMRTVVIEGQLVRDR
jgi:hypothetical protein